MKHSHSKHVGRSTAITAAPFLVMVAQPAWAYLDPGTGSMIISAIVGLFATVGLAVKTYWYKIKAFLRRDAQQEAAGTDPTVDAGAEQGTEPGRSTES